MTNTETKKVLVAGANGFIGSNIAKHLVQYGYEVHIVTRKSSNMWRLAEIISDVRTQYIAQGTTEEFTGILKSVRPDVFINAIGVDQRKGINDEGMTWYGNFMIVLNMTQSIRRHGNILFIHSGSSFEYGRSTLIRNPVREDDRCDPVSEYGISKLLSTEYLEYLGRNGLLQSIVLRIFNAYGQYEDSGRLVPDLIMTSLSNSSIIIKNPKVERDFIHTSDIVGALKSAIDMQDHLKEKFQVLNVGTGESHSVLEVANLVNELTGNYKEIKTESHDVRPENNIPGPVANIGKAKLLLQWTPRFGLKDGLRETIEWFRKHRSLYKKF